MIEFIFMLTHSDRTVPNARAVYDEIRDCNLHYVGFKDIGLPIAELRALSEAIRADGREVMLEVVSEAKEDELRSIRSALEIGVDWLLGGTHPEEALQILGGADGIRYCPFPGRVIGHPSLLRGTIDEIASDADRLTSLPGVHGLDLLAYRHAGPVEPIIEAVVRASRGPVVVAGSIVSEEQIRAVTRLGAWGFTIGGAAFDGVLPASPDIRSQVEWALAAAARAAGAASGA